MILNILLIYEIVNLELLVHLYRDIYKQNGTLNFFKALFEIILNLTSMLVQGSLQYPFPPAAWLQVAGISLS